LHLIADRMMSIWSNKYIIGLTGNIATGKSLVRKMLVVLGAYGIDADALAHRVIQPGTVGYQKVIATFGSAVVTSEGQINRTELGRIVFQDPQALRKLEEIIHPLVDEEIEREILSTKSDIIVVEAIKLIETNLRKLCNSIWVTVADEELQIQRLVEKRNLSREEAQQRIHAQISQEEKVLYADVVIENNGSIRDTWEQVVAAWQDTFPNSVITDQHWEKFLAQEI